MLRQDTGGNTGRLCFWEAIDTRADAREGDALQMVLLSQSHGRIVAGGQQFALMISTAIPNWAYGMDHLLTRQVIGIGHLALSGLTASQRPALFQQSFSCCTVDGAIDASPTQQRPMGRSNMLIAASAITLKELAGYYSTPDSALLEDPPHSK